MTLDVWIREYLAYQEQEMRRRRIHAMAKIIYPSPWGQDWGNIDPRSAHTYASRAYDVAFDSKARA